MLEFGGADSGYSIAAAAKNKPPANPTRMPSGETFAGAISGFAGICNTFHQIFIK
ncbi:hypothetical protein [Methylomonas koyamae]|uniref:hypothetical protein n=1 Tax=Methylomonas koyamae TaxID=702114 RepID=UPI002872C050|nr:hypothetical protein [Methylomonas koyamae]WNB75101.1 hypothetical protein RI210_17715 [Methylomonas koyamae]